MYKNMLFSSCVRILKSREDAEDIVQDSFIKGFQKINQVGEDVNLGAWFRKIAVNASLDMYRKQSKVVWVEESNVLDKEHEEISLDEDPQKTITFIKECIYNLKEKYRVVLVLYMIEDYNHREIAALLKTKESTIRNQYKRGKSQLLEMIQNKKKNGLKRIHTAS